MTAFSFRIHLFPKRMFCGFYGLKPLETMWNVFSRVLFVFCINVHTKKKVDFLRVRHLHVSAKRCIVVRKLRHLLRSLRGRIPDQNEDLKFWAASGPPQKKQNDGKRVQKKVFLFLLWTKLLQAIALTPRLAFTLVEKSSKHGIPRNYYVYGPEKTKRVRRKWVNFIP